MLYQNLAFKPKMTICQQRTLVWQSALIVSLQNMVSLPRYNYFLHSDSHNKLLKPIRTPNSVLDQRNEGIYTGYISLKSTRYQSNKVFYLFCTLVRSMRSVGMALWRASCALNGIPRKQRKLFSANKVIANRLSVKAFIRY